MRTSCLVSEVKEQESDISLVANNKQLNFNGDHKSDTGQASINNGTETV